jgi:hypothetical protein
VSFRTPGAAAATGAAPVPGSRLVVACDLDRTLIYSAGAAGTEPGAGVPDQRLVCVELLDGQPLSFMTAAAAAAVRELGQIAVFVPTTTRTRLQLARVVLPGPAPRYAIAANGGFLLVDGRSCPDWTAHVTAVLAASGEPLEVVYEHLRKVCAADFTRMTRTAENLFCYAGIERDRLPAALVPELGAWATERGWVASLQGRKLYLVPAALTKGAAVSEVALRVGASRVLAAGDSLLDAELLAAADLGIRPGHGELAETGWDAAHVVTTPGAGVVAGEQIAVWLLQLARAAAADAAGPAPEGSAPAGRSGPGRGPASTSQPGVRV